MLPRVSLSAVERPPANFFFSAIEMPERIALLRQHLPGEVEVILREADEIRQHCFRLLGYGPLDYGKEIDWHLDAVHGKRAPNLPAYQIDFLDFDAVGDHKVTWELSRHQHLVTLAKAWHLTREARYVEEAVTQWYSWQKANRYPMGINWASSLEVAFRSLSWLWMRHLLIDWPGFSSALRDDLLRALALNARHIDRYRSTYFSPNTHLLGEGLALFFIGVLCPDLREAERWKLQGWTILLHESQRQVLPDGVYFEQSLYYHVYALDFFVHAHFLAARNGIAIPSAFDDVLRKMLTVVQVLSQANFGDDDGGRLFNPRRNRAEHMTDPLALGTALYPDRFSAPELTEEAIWLFGRDAIRKATATIDPHSCSFPDAGLYLIADLNPIPQQLLIDAGPQGAGRCGHGHADALNVSLSLHRRPCLVDSGTCAYIARDNVRQQFRGTRAHNTLAVDGLDQAEPAGPFAWTALPDVKMETWISAQTFSFFAGYHIGYERFPQPVRHRRFIFHPHGGFWLVRDLAEGTGSHLLETSWHFAPDLEVTKQGNIFVASPTGKKRQPKQLMLVPADDPRWTCEVVSEFISPAYGVKVPAPVVRCATRMQLPVDHAMLLIPVNDAEAFHRHHRAEIGSGTTCATAYLYETSATTHVAIFKPADCPVWNVDALTTNADFLYYSLSESILTHLVVCGASSLHINGVPLFSCDMPLQYLEWTRQNAEQRVSSPDEAAARAVVASGLLIDPTIQFPFTQRIR